MFTLSLPLFSIRSNSSVRARSRDTSYVTRVAAASVQNTPAPQKYVCRRSPSNRPVTRWIEEGAKNSGMCQEGGNPSDLPLPAFHYLPLDSQNLEFFIQNRPQTPHFDTFMTLQRGIILAIYGRVRHFSLLVLPAMKSIFCLAQPLRNEHGTQNRHDRWQ
jgi:hypothetical protein